MSTTVTEFRRGFVSAVSHRDQDVSSLVSGEYDAVIVTSSWDARCISITETRSLRADLGIGIFFTTRDDQGLRDKHDPLLEMFLKSTARRTDFITGDSCDVSGLWLKLHAVLLKLRQERRRPLRLFMDLSTCPRYYSLAVAASAFAERLANTVVFFYAEAIYDNEGVRRGDFAFTGGHWSTVSVPFLSGIFNPSKKIFYLVSVGFEGEKTFRAVSRADPDRVSILFAKPGYCTEYELRSAEANRDLVREFLIPKSQLLCAPASDAVATWRTLAQSQVHREDDENTFYLTCGTKPHALALALNAISLGHPAVLYNIPEEHRVHTTKPGDKFWTYEVRDVTALE